MLDRSPAQMPHASKPGRIWALMMLVVAFYWSVLVLSSAIFGLTWPINFMIFVGLAMSVAARCSLNHLLPSYAAYAWQIQRPVVLLLSSLFSTAGHCLRLRIPIWHVWLPTVTVLSGTQTSIAFEMLWGKHWQWMAMSRQITCATLFNVIDILTMHQWKLWLWTDDDNTATMHLPCWRSFIVKLTWPRLAANLASADGNTETWASATKCIINIKYHDAVMIYYI